MCVSEVQVSDECEVEDLTHNPAYAEYVFVQRWGWETLPSLTTVRTASGERIAGVRHLLANTRFTPTFTHRVAFGVLDLPGFDGLLGVGFLNKFTAYATTVQDATNK